MYIGVPRDLPEGGGGGKMVTSKKQKQKRKGLHFRDGAAHA